MISKVLVLDTRNELLDTDTRLVLAFHQVTRYYSGEAESPEYLFGNSNTQYVFTI